MDRDRGSGGLPWGAALSIGEGVVWAGGGADEGVASRAEAVEHATRIADTRRQAPAPHVSSPSEQQIRFLVGGSQQARLILRRSARPTGCCRGWGRVLDERHDPVRHEAPGPNGL